MPENYLYYGDNLDVLRRYVKDESVDLIYLDPPFNSRQDYNVLFAEKDGSRSVGRHNKRINQSALRRRSLLTRVSAACFLRRHVV